MTERPPLTLYVHTPWCVRKCPYCDFNSHTLHSDLPEADYVTALLKDLDYEGRRVEGREVLSIFIGGGTPSLFSAEAIAALIAGSKDRLALSADPEITLECNPGTLSFERLFAYRRAGINRISIGVQSFRDGPLAAIGRIHSGADALSAFDAARSAGFENINLDLMFGLPEDTRQGAISDLEQAILLGPDHLSWYQLTLEPNTAFFRHPPPLPDEEILWDTQVSGQALLAERGFGQYEVSAYARGERVCRHNLNYWEFGDYLGIGAGAHSKLSDPQTQTIVRGVKCASPSAFMASAGSADCTLELNRVREGEVVVEFMMNALRLKGGFPPGLFVRRTGLPLAAIEPPLRQAVDRGLLTVEAERIRPTVLGQRFLNELIYHFYSDEGRMNAASNA